MIDLKKPVVSIMGCGWLGLPLAKTLRSNGLQVKGSTTSQEKLNVLIENEIEAFLVQFPNADHSKLNDFLKTDVLLIAIPPGRTGEKRNAYRSMVDEIIQRVPYTNINTIILISSTSVFGDVNSSVTEEDVPRPETESGQLLLETEKRINDLRSIRKAIIRPAGLIGPQRHPSRFFSGKKLVDNGAAPVNLIHLDDVIGVIQTLLADENASGVYHLAAPDHPSKKDFYTAACKHQKLQAPTFKDEADQWKEVNSVRLKQDLDYDFKYADLFEALAAC